jgi:hypothetical protein
LTSKNPKNPGYPHPQPPRFYRYLKKEGFLGTPVFRSLRSRKPGIDCFGPKPGFPHFDPFSGFWPVLGVFGVLVRPRFLTYFGPKTGVWRF